MAKTVKSTRSNLETEPMQKGWRYEFAGILLVAVALLCIVSLYLAPPNELTPGTTGLLGNILARSLTLLAGDGRYFMAIFLGVWGLVMILQRRCVGLSRKLYGFFALFLCGLTFLHLQLPWIESGFWPLALQGQGGGLVGALLAWFLVGIFGVIGSYIVVGAVVLLSLLGITNQSLVVLVRKLWAGLVVFWHRVLASADQFLFVPVEEDGLAEKGASPPSGLGINPENLDHDYVDPENQLTANGAEDSPGDAAEKALNYFSTIPAHRNIFENEAEEEILFPAAQNFTLPPLDLLRPLSKEKNSRQHQGIKDSIQVLEETLRNFGVKAKVADVQQGPAITRYEIQPAPGIKVSKILNLADDISLSMAAEHVRIEAPIPGKSAIGIEVPNQEISTVPLREVLENPKFKESAARLSVAFGKDIAGHTVVGDLAKMPHLLIAGATGMGKSVCLNALIASILFKSSPNEVKLLMIDPKMVELTTYNGIPHLITPVVTSPKKAAIALRWAVTQMEKRYEKFAASGAKDIIRYNKAKLKEELCDEVLPYLVIIIDELADLMMIAPADVEDAICRLAQMARAAGIHLVIATQRPSVDVITGLIKANIPSRVAFAVSSQTDSRTILDVGGAEKLVGRGDMLYLPVGFAKPVRVQGAFISDDEVEQLVDFLKQQETPKFIEGVTAGESKPVEQPEEEEALFPDAVRLFIETGQASISSLQRRFRIGYTRAARLIDIMEKKGVVGPFEGSKPREVLLTIEEFEKRYGKF